MEIPSDLCYTQIGSYIRTLQLSHWPWSDQSGRTMKNNLSRCHDTLERKLGYSRLHMPASVHSNLVIRDRKALQVSIQTCCLVTLCV